MSKNDLINFVIGFIIGILIASCIRCKADPVTEHNQISTGQFITIAAQESYTTLARVELGNQPVFNDCTMLHIQPPVSWNNTSITIEFNTGSFRPGDQTYLFIINGAGTASEGIPIVIPHPVSTSEESYKHKNYLSNATPNPFNPVTNISYSIAKETLVNITVYNIAGRKIKTLVNENLSAGEYMVQWKGLDSSGVPVASGVYLYKLETRNMVEIRSMTLIK